MKKVVLCIVCLLFSCSSVPDKKNIEKSETQYQFGISFMREGKYQDAFVKFQQSVEYNPGNKQALNALGLIYIQFENFPEAEETFLRALDVDKNFSEAHNNLGLVYSRERKWDQAIIQFEKALENPFYISPERAFTNLGNVYYRQKKYDRAIDSYRKAVRRVQNFYPAYYGLALGYNMVENYGEAASSISTGIKYDPEIIGDREKAADIFHERMLMTADEVGRKDYIDLIEILNY